MSVPVDRQEERTVIGVSCDPEMVELVADELWQCGASAVAEQPSPTGGPRLTADILTARLADLRERLDRMVPPPAMEFLEADTSWAEAWKPYATAVGAGPFVVHPPWVDPGALAVGTGEVPRIDLVVDPGATFGSGSHPSTRLSLVALADVAARRTSTAPATGWTVADIGCGSGVLATGALLLGAQAAVGVDVDPPAGDVSTAVARANGVGARYVFREGGIGALVARGESFDVVLANLLIPVIEELGGDLRAICAPGGVVVVSGLLSEHRARALAALRADGPQAPELLGEYHTEGWLTLVTAP